MLKEREEKYEKEIIALATVSDETGYFNYEHQAHSREREQTHVHRTHHTTRTTHHTPHTRIQHTSISLL